MQAASHRPSQRFADGHPPKPPTVQEEPVDGCLWLLWALLRWKPHPPALTAACRDLQPSTHRTPGVGCISRFPTRHHTIVETRFTALVLTETQLLATDCAGPSQQPPDISSLSIPAPLSLQRPPHTQTVPRTATIMSTHTATHLFLHHRAPGLQVAHTREKSPPGRHLHIMHATAYTEIAGRRSSQPSSDDVRWLHSRQSVPPPP